MYKVYANNNVIHNPFRSDENLVLIEPVLQEKLNAHGSFEFKIAPNHPYYNSIEPRKTKIKIVSDALNNKPWFGRVISIQRGWNNLLSVYCEGELSSLCDSTFMPFGFKGAPLALLTRLINNYNGSQTDGFSYSIGNVSVTDPNNYIVRSSNAAQSVWEAMKNSLFGSSLGGYIFTRYEFSTDTHYVDYLSLDANDQYAKTSSQEIQFGKNLLDFVQSWDASDIITVLIPFGKAFAETDPEYEAGPPENGDWNGNRLTIASVNNNRKYVQNSQGIAMYGRIVGTKTWDDVTVAANLKTKATQWLADQIWQSVTLELTAVDLSAVDVDIEQIQVGEYVRCKSKPHDINVLLLCTEKTTHLTANEQSNIILGAGLKTFTDLQKGESK